MLINRYVLKVKPRTLKNAKIGDIIFHEQDPTQIIPAGFIANIFKKTKSLEICLFKPININDLKTEKENILYYESKYDTKHRQREIEQQGK